MRNGETNLIDVNEISMVLTRLLTFLCDSMKIKSWDNNKIFTALMDELFDSFRHYSGE